MELVIAVLALGLMALADGLLGLLKPRDGGTVKPQPPSAFEYEDDGHY